jgi:DNA helicase INO80
MTGAPPYNAQSPTQQQHRFAAYESPTKNRPFFPNNDQPQGQQQQQQQFSQHPPQTPPAFGPSSVPRSPRFSHASSPLPSTLPPPLNGTAPPPHSSHAESSSQYPGPSGSANPGLPLPRPFSSSVMSGNGTSPYGPSTPHSHPASRPDSHSQSPPRESESPYRVRGNGVGYGSSAPKAASPSRESVCP